jgi:hypothetical protein
MRPFIFIGIINFFFSLYSHSSYSYECMNDQQKDALWTRAIQNLYGSKRLIYRDQDRSVRLPIFPAFFSSSEWHFNKAEGEYPRSSGDLHIGFGSNLNFNLLTRPGTVLEGVSDNTPQSVFEKTRTAIFVDSSPEVLMGLVSFWRPLWLISETKEEWLSYVAGLSPSLHLSVPEVFLKINERHAQPAHELTSQDLLQKDAFITEVRNKLDSQVSASKISTTDAAFTLALLQEAAYGCPEKVPASLEVKVARRHDYYFEGSRHGVFKNCVNCTSIDLRISDLCNQSEIMDEIQVLLSQMGSENRSVPLSELQSVLAERNKELENFYQTSYLSDSVKYDRVRKVFLNNQDYYAQSFLQDVKFWQSAGELSREKNAVLTDVYLTCLPQVLRNDTFEYPDFKYDRDIDHLIGLASTPGREVTRYESMCHVPVKRYKIDSLLFPIPNRNIP